jgi:rhodanese-related sulfurtransferase
MYAISPVELKARLDKGEEFQIIDIREVEERDICSLKSEHIPMEKVLESASQLRRDIPVVIHCKAGDRASAVVHMLRMKHHMDNVYNLAGGIIAWANQVDPKMSTY